MLDLRDMGGANFDISGGLDNFFFLGQALIRSIWLVPSAMHNTPFGSQPRLSLVSWFQGRDWAGQCAWMAVVFSADWLHCDAFEFFHSSLPWSSRFAIWLSLASYVPESWFTSSQESLTTTNPFAFMCLVVLSPLKTASYWVSFFASCQNVCPSLACI